MSVLSIFLFTVLLFQDTQSQRTTLRNRVQSRYASIEKDFAKVPDRLRTRIQDRPINEKDSVKLSDRLRARIQDRSYYENDSAKLSDRFRTRIQDRHSNEVEFRPSQPTPRLNPQEVDLTQYGRGFIKREITITKINHPGPDNKICFLDEKDMASLCNGCAQVYEKVYGSRIHSLRPVGLSGRCVEKPGIFGRSLEYVFVRKCPFTPTFYLSQGNRPGSVFVYLPFEFGRIRFRVHLSPFREMSASKLTFLGHGQGRQRFIRSNIRAK